MTDVSKTERRRTTAGLDLGDKHSHLCLIDTESGEVIEESRLRTTPEAFERRFGSEEPLKIAVEVGTHSPWVSRLLKHLGHEVLVANARKVRLIYAEGRKTDRIDAEKLARLTTARSLAALSHRAPGRGLPGPPGPNPLARGAGTRPNPTGQPRARNGQVLRSSPSQMLGWQLPLQGC